MICKQQQIQPNHIYISYFFIWGRGTKNLVYVFFVNWRVFSFLQMVHSVILDTLNNQSWVGLETVYSSLLAGIVTNLLNLVSIHGFSGADAFQSNSNPTWHFPPQLKDIKFCVSIGRIVSKKKLCAFRLKSISLKCPTGCKSL